jgi:hypothetical protein
MGRILASVTIASAIDSFRSMRCGALVGAGSRTDYPPLDDETIDRIADESFLEYDVREAVRL